MFITFDYHVINLRIIILVLYIIMCTRARIYYYCCCCYCFKRPVVVTSADNCLRVLRTMIITIVFLFSNACFHQVGPLTVLHVKRRDNEWYTKRESLDYRAEATSARRSATGGGTRAHPPNRSHDCQLYAVTATTKLI